MTTPIGRDFKRSGARGGGVRGGARGGRGWRPSREHWQGFAAGAALGLLLALAALAWAQSRLRGAAAEAAEPAKPVPREPAARRGGGDPDADAADSAQYDFYDRLKNQSVVVPENAAAAGAAPPASLIERPGSYVLELGNWREAADAERMRAKAARLGVTATAQGVPGPDGGFHRVRVGPLSDLGELNRIRARLRAADIDALVIRVGD